MERERNIFRKRIIKRKGKNELFIRIVNYVLIICNLLI